MKNVDSANSVDISEDAIVACSDNQMNALLDLFRSASSTNWKFRKVGVESLTADAADLLAHHHHMTVTLEKYHGCPVDVHVLEFHSEGDHYARKIKLTRQSDDSVVMFGVVRMDKTVFSDAVREEIESQQTPLGRVLIENNVLRVVKLLGLYRIEASGDLADSFGVDAGTVCFGRTALIYCDGAKAIELLEIVPGE
jgi:chorismate-pyruvate lyase